MLVRLTTYASLWHVEACWTRKRIQLLSERSSGGSTKYRDAVVRCHSTLFVPDVPSHLDIRGIELEHPVVVQRVDIDAARDEDVAGEPASPRQSQVRHCSHRSVSQCSVCLFADGSATTYAARNTHRACPLIFAQCRSYVLLNLIAVVQIQRLHSAIDSTFFHVESGTEGRETSLGDGLQRPLDAVEDLLHEAGAQLHGQRLAGPVHRVADRQPGRVLVALRSGEWAQR